MRKILNILIIISIPIAIGWACYKISGIHLRKVEWVSFGTPPEKAIQIVCGGYNENVIIETINGEQYSYVDGEWKKGKEEKVCSFSDVDYCPIPIPPGLVIDHIETCYGYETYYVVLKDGSVWGYTQFIGDIDFRGFIDFVSEIVAGIGGLIVGLLISTKLWKHYKNAGVV